MKSNWKGPDFPTDRVCKNFWKALEVRVCIEHELLYLCTYYNKSAKLGAGFRIFASYWLAWDGRWRVEITKLSCLPRSVFSMKIVHVASAIIMLFSVVFKLRRFFVLKLFYLLANKKFEKKPVINALCI